MAHLYKIVLFFLCLLVAHLLLAQSAATPKKIKDLFNDLPIETPEEYSVLGEGENAAEKISANMLLKAQLAKTVYYRGEPILLRYKLYTRLQSRSELFKIPEFEGCTAHPILLSNDVEAQYEWLNHQKYRVYEIGAWQLFSFQTGLLSIPALKVYNSVSYDDAKGHTQVYEGYLQSGSGTINVIDLPAPPPGKKSSSIVGRFEIDCRLESDTIAAGEINQLHITIRGNGNFADITPPDIIWPVGTQILTIKTATAIDFGRFPAEGDKRFTIPFVMNKPGEVIIPGFDFVFFDASKKVYEQVPIAEQKVRVTAGRDELTPGNISNTGRISTPVIFIVVAGALIVLLAGGMFLYHGTRKQRAGEATVQNYATEENDVGVNSIAARLIALNEQEDHRAYMLAVKECVNKGLLDGAFPTEAICQEAKQLVDYCNGFLFMPVVIEDEERRRLVNRVHLFCHKDEFAHTNKFHTPQKQDV